MVAVRSTAEVSGPNPLFLGLAMRIGVGGKESSEQSPGSRNSAAMCLNSDGEVEGDLILKLQEPVVA